MQLKRIFASIATAAVAIGGLVPTAYAVTNGNIAIDNAHFPDRNFREVVSVFDINKDGALDFVERNEVTAIAAGSSDIASVQGIEYFHNLAFLYVPRNRITSVDLTRNTALKSIHLGDNQLSAIDISSNTGLTVLDLSDNRLSAIDISAQTKLTTLHLANNQLSSLDTTRNTSLEWLTLEHNHISSLDTTRNTALKWLILGNNRLLGVAVPPQFNGTFVAEEQSYTAYGSSLDLARVSPTIDVSRISHVEGGQLTGSVLIPNARNGMVSYAYDAGNNHVFQAQVQFMPIVFKDVNATTAHREDIEWLADNGISTGWQEADGTFTFRGTRTVVRQDMAAFLRRLAVKNNIGDAAQWEPSDQDWQRFKDVNQQTPHARDILWLAHAGISTGWQESDGTFSFRGTSPVVRQDMAAFLKRLADQAGKSGGVVPKTDFTDVAKQTPHKTEVQWLGGSGISQGYVNADGVTRRFEGTTPVYRQDMAAFLHRLDTLLNR